MRAFRVFRSGLFLAAASVAACAYAGAREFTVLVYNVENLFDVDGVSLFEDYKQPGYTTVHLSRKLANVSRVLQRFNEGQGPEVVMFIEFEADQTPERASGDLPGFLAQWSGRKASDLLTSAEALPPGLAGAPAYAWLLKQVTDDGMQTYNVAVGRWRPDPTGQVVAQHNVLFSRFPIVEATTHDTNGARGILEVTLSVDGRPLHVFVNHWKSGASDPETESVRIGNATVMRRRLDAILRRDPNADVVIGGDFNSQYNQKEMYPAMRRTAINDVLGSQGDELALRDRRGPALYNLWFELPNEKRGSDVYRDLWGTLMQVLVTRGLYDFRGVQYVDNSFSVAAFPELNVNLATQSPVRWQFAEGGSGFSDHFPVAARFRTVERNENGKWMKLENPSRTKTGPSEAVPVRLSLDAVADLASWPAGKEFLTADHLARHFHVAGSVTSTKPFRVRADGPGVEIAVWIRDAALRTAYFEKHRVGDRIEFIGELGQYRGEWQLVIPESLVPQAK